MAHNHDPFSPKAAVKLQDPSAPASKGKPSDTVMQSPPPDKNPVKTDAGVPKGTTNEITEWVGDDRNKAKQALEAEEKSGEPRRGLVKKLQEIIG